jgi:hypothetical protein
MRISEYAILRVHSDPECTAESGQVSAIGNWTQRHAGEELHVEARWVKENILCHLQSLDNLAQFWPACSLSLVNQAFTTKNKRQ